MVLLLSNVTEGQFHNHLSEPRVSLAPFHSLRVPDHVVHLRRLAALIEVFPGLAQTQRDTDACLRPAVFITVALRNRFLFEAIDQLVMGHVHEYFLTVVVLGLDHETGHWLDDRTAL